MFKYLEKKKIILVYVPLIVYWITLITATSLPTKSLPSVAVGDKLEHFGAFFVLSFLLGLTMLYQNKNSFIKKHFLAASVIISSFYGMLDELHQYFIPGRYCELLDWLADFSGSVAGVLLLLYLLKKFQFIPDQA